MISFQGRECIKEISRAARNLRQRYRKFLMYEEIFATEVSEETLEIRRVNQDLRLERLQCQGLAWVNPSPGSTNERKP